MAQLFQSQALRAVAQLTKSGATARVSPVAAAAYALGFVKGAAHRAALSTTAPALTDGPVEIFRKSYTPSPFACSHIDLDFNLDETTTVKAVFQIVRQADGDLILGGPEDAEVSVQWSPSDVGGPASPHCAIHTTAYLSLDPP